MKQGEVDIRLTGLKEIPELCDFYRRAMRHYNGEHIDVNLSVKVLPIQIQSTVALLLSVEYITTRHYLRCSLLKYTISAEFEIDRLEEHVKSHGADFIVSTRLMTMMLSVAIGSIRGMLSLRTASTPLANYPLPIFNISELISRMHYGDNAPEGCRPLTGYVYN